MEWLILAAALLVGIPAAAWFAQDRLVFPVQPTPVEARLPAPISALEVVAADGTRLRGWIRTARAAPAPVILYFGGNAEEVSGTIADPRWPSDWSVVALNYRGYGRSEGSPSEAALVADARRIHDTIAARSDVDASRIVALGRSLGAGVAVKLAAERPVAAVILASPFDSLVAVGETHFGWLPVSWLLRHRFELVPHARRATVPLLSIVSQHDSIVPLERSRALHEAWAGPKTWQTIAGTDHNSLAMPDEYWRVVARFLEHGMPAGVGER